MSEKHRQLALRTWADPEIRARRLAGIRRTSNSPTVIANKRVARRLFHANHPEFSKAISVRASVQMNQPEAKEAFRSSVIARLSDAEYRKQLGAKVSATLRRKYASGELAPPNARSHYCERGWLQTLTAGLIYYRSSWEKFFAMILDCSSAVLSFKYEPFRIPYEFDGKTRTYFPDFLVETTERKSVVELRPPCYTVGAKEQAKFSSARAFCAERNMRFHVATNWSTALAELVQ